MNERRARIHRETGETRIALELNIDGTGEYEVNTGIGMLDHLLAQLARHGAFDLKIDAQGDRSSDQHHLVEDIGISLGKALSEGLGERRGIVRMAHAIVPMDEALALVALDLSGRGYAAVEISFGGQAIGDLPSELVGHFLETLAIEARMNLHVQIFRGDNDHHKAEALFKALARALDKASRIDPRIAEKIPSTKGVIDS